MPIADADCTGRFLDLPPEMCDPRSAVAAVLPVPYDATSSWHKGADRGPDALLDASAVVEWYDIETRNETCRRGIVTLPPIRHGGDPVSLAGTVRARVGDVFERGWLPIVLGGEHSVTIGAVEAAADRREGLTVLQIDAHADTREQYHGSTHNHACVMARARERADVVQVGIRAIDASEAEGLDPARTFFAHDIDAATDEAWTHEVADLVRGRPTYVTIDMDAFDPALVPATGTPEPGGLTWGQVNRLLGRVCEATEVVAFDVVELCPREGQHASDMVAAKLVYRLLAEILARR